MMNKIISEIDAVINEIKSKENNSSFNVEELLQFEFIFFLTLEIARYEILTASEITDSTGGALSQLFAFPCFEFYYRDFPDIFLKTSELLSILSPLNKKLLNHDVEHIEGFTNHGQTIYFNQYISSLITGKEKK